MAKRGTIIESRIAQFLAALRYKRDDRALPDNLRWGQFKAGWGDWAVRRQKYRDKTLQVLTWDNLGYRAGSHFRYRSARKIEQVYRKLAALYKTREDKGIVSLPGEAEENGVLVEGALHRIKVNKYERNAEVRRRCIAHHGTSCSVCGFSFGRTYGLVAEGFIHVHHLRGLSELGKEYVPDPKEDLRPVCPNCHAVIHRRTPAFRIDEVKAFLRHVG